MVSTDNIISTQYVFYVCTVIEFKSYITLLKAIMYEKKKRKVANRKWFLSCIQITYVNMYIK